MASAPLKVLRRADYAPVPFTTRNVELNFDIKAGITRVEAKLQLQRLPAVPEGPIVLNRGDPEVQSIVSIELDGKLLSQDEYKVDEKVVTIAAPAGAASVALRIVTDVRPEKNTSLEGLYYSGGSYTTQCEAEGFRNITLFQDRPDVMATYTVRVEADKESCPVLLSNGNLVESGAVAGSEGRHFTVWKDPYPKPCYLFALVAGNLTAREDSFTTMEGRAVALRIFTAPKDVPKTSWAMESLKRSMKWDEERFGRAYDLDVFNIVAVSDFNMGAMENKSLNIFNSRLVLASKETASDVDYNRIEGVVAHEYFHNWTGNRVTCRDWFQLTLKEGLTVYRDQEFTADHNSRPVKRLEDVTRLRLSQFGEDAGPTAHPIRPDEVGKMDNFYTATVYEKGAEIIRIYATVLGREGFRKGMDLYFARHDGQAVTCDDFFAAMHDANPEAEVVASGDIMHLKTWYSQAGTPQLTVEPVYDAASQSLTLKCAQKTPATPGQPSKAPVLVPIATGLIGPDGKEIPLVLNGKPVQGGTAVLRLTTAAADFTFSGVPAGTVPSILRGFSAPVRLTVVGQTEADLAHLLAHDSDAFNRFEAGQRLGRAALLSLYAKALPVAETADATGANGHAAIVQALDAAGGVPSAVVDAFKSVLADKSIDGAFMARAITLPAETELVDTLAQGGCADPVVVHEVREYAVRALARALRPQLEEAIARSDAEIAAAEAVTGGYSPDFTAVARRAIRNKSLAYLSTLAGEDKAVVPAIYARYQGASNMTDQVATLAALVDQPAACAERAAALAAFAEQFKDEPLVLLKWLGLQAGSTDPGNTATVQALTESPAFSYTNPNSCYTLFGIYSSSSVPAFHAKDGSGYRFLAEVVRKLDGINAQVAARIVGAFTRFKLYDTKRAALMKAELEKLAAGKLSENVGEIVARSLASA